MQNSSVLTSFYLLLPQYFTITIYQVDHVLAQFILQSTKRLPDHRLLASALAARLLIHSEARGTDDGGLDTLAVRDNII